MVKNTYITVFSVLGLIVIFSSFQPSLAEKYIELEKPINLRVTTLENMFDDVETFVTIFSNEIKLSEIKNNGNIKSAHIFIDLPAWGFCDIDTGIKVTKQNDLFIIDYSGRTLDQSKMMISLEKTWGWDDKQGEPAGATNIFLKFFGKNIPCEAFVSEELLKNTLSDGLYRLQQAGLQIEKIEQDNFTLPSWLKTSAKWWSDGATTDLHFVSSIKFMIKEDIVKIPMSDPDYKLRYTADELPKWLKTNAGWWAGDKISDVEFVRNIQYMIDNEIIKVF